MCNVQHGIKNLYYLMKPTLVLTFNTTMAISSKNMIQLPVISGVKSMSPKLKIELHLRHN